METNITYVGTLDDREAVARMFDRYDFLAIPVVDGESRLVGIITVDDAIDVIQEENTEDIEKMAAILPSEDSYLKTPAWKHAKNRFFWLLFLMLSATVTGGIISAYENAFTAIPILVAFVPMLMGTGGNCGSQSSTLIIRGLALEEIRFRDFFKVLFKEIRIALLVGVVLALVNAVRIFLVYQGNADVLAQASLTELSLISGLSLIGIVVLAKSIGCILPMLAKKCKLDPALMAAPLLTTILDTCSVLIFFSIAMKILCK
jgi:magnesium transporter